MAYDRPVRACSLGTEKELEGRLKRAVGSGDTVAFRRLVKGGVDVNAKFWFCSSLLHEAVQVGKLEIVNLLLQNGADINAKNDGDRTPLHMACRVRHRQDIVDTLIRHGAKVNLQTKDGQTALHVAVWRGKEDSVKSLLAAGADPNLKDKDGWLPIHWAVKLNYVGMVRDLIHHGSTMDEPTQRRTKNQITPIIQAVINSNVSLATLLTIHGANVDRVYENKTCLERVMNDKSNIPSPVRIALCKLLVDNGRHANRTHLFSHQHKDVNRCGEEKIELWDNLFEVPSLASLCRGCVRSRVRQKCHDKSVIGALKQLPLPTILIEFLCYSDELIRLELVEKNVPCENGPLKGPV